MPRSSLAMTYCCLTCGWQRTLAPSVTERHLGVDFFISCPDCQGRALHVSKATLLAGWLASYRRHKAEKRNTSDHPGA